MVLTSLTCTLCKTLRQNPRLAALTEEWPSIQFVWVDEKQDLLNPPLKGWTVAVDPDRAALTAFAVPATPFAYVIDTTGRVAGKSLVNTPSDMAALLGRLFPDSALEGRASQAQSA
jgi:hypothetical protein